MSGLKPIIYSFAQPVSGESKLIAVALMENGTLLKMIHRDTIEQCKSGLGVTPGGEGSYDESHHCYTSSTVKGYTLLWVDDVMSCEGLCNAIRILIKRNPSVFKRAFPRLGGEDDTTATVETERPAMVCPATRVLPSGRQSV